MKKALISRYGAYGDIIHCSHLPRLLKEHGYDVVDFDTNFKGYQLLSLNPFIDNCIGYEPRLPYDMLAKRWEAIAEKYDTFINLYHSLEYNVIAMEDQGIYYRDSEKRREFGRGNFYDVTTIWAGFPELVGKYRGEVYYEDSEHEFMGEFISKYDGKFKVMLNLSGSGPHKRLVQVEEIKQRIEEKYGNVQFFTTGDSRCKSFDQVGDNVFSLISRDKPWPFRQALHLAKYMDCVIGCESGIMVGANMWETPTIQLMTSSSLENHPNCAKNDFSIQSPAYCSPCHKGPYRYIGCPKKDGYALCATFNIDEIMENVQKCYEVKYEV